MKPPICIRRSLYNNPLWYKTNIPFPEDNNELLQIELFWRARFQYYYRKHAHIKDPLFLSFRMIYSRYMELNWEIKRRASKGAEFQLSTKTKINI